MDFRYDTNDEVRDLHRQRKAFIIIDGNLEFLPEGSSMSHYEYCQTKGISKEEFNQIIRGYYKNGFVVFYKDNFTYDEDVITCGLQMLDLISSKIGVSEFDIYFGHIVENQKPGQEFPLDYHYGKYINGTITRYTRT
jgi:hypothetical protein